MHCYRHLMSGLARTDADAGLIRYAAMVARLGTASEVRFVHVLPSSAGPSVATSKGEDSGLESDSHHQSIRRK